MSVCPPFTCIRTLIVSIGIEEKNTTVRSRVKSLTSEDKKKKTAIEPKVINWLVVSLRAERMTDDQFGHPRGNASEKPMELFLVRLILSSGEGWYGFKC